MRPIMLQITNKDAEPGYISLWMDDQSLEPLQRTSHVDIREKGMQVQKEQILLERLKEIIRTSRHASGSG